MNVGWDSSVGVATRYRLVGPGFESRWVRDIPHSSITGLGPTPPCLNGYRVSFLGVKRPGGGFDHPPQSSVEVTERVELYVYSLSGLSWPLLG